MQELRNLLLLFFLFLSLMSCERGTPVTSENTHPNIVFIFADDMGYGDLQCYNPQSQIATRNIDRLAEEGMRFTDAHAPAAVCVPSRYSLLTGHYPFLNNRKYQEGFIEPGRPTLASDFEKRPVIKQPALENGIRGLSTKKIRRRIRTLWVGRWITALIISMACRHLWISSHIITLKIGVRWPCQLIRL